MLMWKKLSNELANILEVVDASLDRFARRASVKDVSIALDENM